MNTKQIVWSFFNKYLLKLAKEKGITEIDFTKLLFLIHKFGNVYDNRTAKNWIDCMVDNGWLIPDNEDTIYDVLGKYVVTSIYKYRNVKWTINLEAKFDLINEDEILTKLFEK